MTEKVELPTRVVLDSNVIVIALSKRAGYSKILDSLFNGEFELYLTTEILLEYEEVLTRFYDEETTRLLLGALSLLDNIKKIDVYFNFYLIDRDKDDDKFVDCAFAGNVHYLVSNDKHFNVLKNIEFPKINLIKIDEFMKILPI